jgi:pimeloyl-ACP methyl ester carboxylesterase
MTDFNADHTWVLGGHSRGAAIATRLIERVESEFEGLVLIGTTHPRLDLSSLNLPVLKIGGTEDCVAPRARAEMVADSLPGSTRWEWIEGANHAQFGWYGRQLRDCAATISREQQQAEMTRIVDEFLSTHGSAS